MTASTLEYPLRAINDLVSQQGGTDRQLLARFAHNGDQHAFAALVNRHRTLVWGVCRRVLRHHQDAEDAFQATFLVLARKANAVRWQSSIAGWLYQVAFRTSQQAQRLRNRGRQREQHLPADVESPQERECPAHDGVREELLALPEKYRLPLFLCHVEGMSCREAAERLGWSDGSLRGRLHRGRMLFRKRMLRRGIKRSVVSAVILRLLDGVPAVASNLQIDTLRAVSELIATGGAATVADSQSIILMKGVLQTMGISKTKKVLFLSLLAIAIGWFTAYALAAQESPLPKNPVTSSVQPNAAGEGNAKQKEKWQNLFASIDVKKDRVGPGVWRMKKDKLIGYPAAHGGRLRIPVVPKGEYELRVKWQPRSADSCAHFIVPHGDRRASIELLSYFKCAGLGDLNGVRPDINETRTDLNIKPGKIYTVLVRMKYTKKQIYVTAKLDDKTIVNWEGDRSEVEHGFYAPPKPASLGVAVSGNASTFHSMELRMLSGQAMPWKGKSKAKTSRR